MCTNVTPQQYGSRMTNPSADMKRLGYGTDSAAFNSALGEYRDRYPKMAPTTKVMGKTYYGDGNYKRQEQRKKHFEEYMTSKAPAQSGSGGSGAAKITTRRSRGNLRIR